MHPAKLANLEDRLRHVLANLPPEPFGPVESILAALKAGIHDPPTVQQAAYFASLFKGDPRIGFSVIQDPTTHQMYPISNEIMDEYDAVIDNFLKEPGWADKFSPDDIYEWLSGIVMSAH